MMRACANATGSSFCAGAIKVRAARRGMPPCLWLQVNVAEMEMARQTERERERERGGSDFGIDDGR